MASKLFAMGTAVVTCVQDRKTTAVLQRYRQAGN